MSVPRTRWLTWSVGASLLIGAGLLVSLSRISLRNSEAAELARNERAAEVASPLPEPPVELGASDAEGTRVELLHEPDAVGPRRIRAKVELLCSLSGSVGSAEEVRIQVLADSDASQLDERAPYTTFSVPNAQQLLVVDVTELLMGTQPIPSRLQILAETPRCRTFSEVPLDLSPEELAGPNPIRRYTSVHFGCPWYARGRIVAPCPPGAVKVYEGVSSDSRVRNLSPAPYWRVDEQGVFKLPLFSPGPMFLTFRAEGAQSVERAFVVDGQGDVELGDIVLESGATLSGQLLAAGRPLAYAEVALVHADAPIAVDAPLEGSGDAWAGSVRSRPVLRGMLTELGLFAENDGSIEPIAMARTNGEGRFDVSTLRPGKHWFIVLSAGNQLTWLAPTSFEAPLRGLMHDFEATRVRFDFGRARFDPLREVPVRSLYVRLPDSGRVVLDSGIQRFEDLHALVQPGALLELRACDQNVLVPVVPSTEPLLKRITRCD